MLQQLNKKGRRFKAATTKEPLVKQLFDFIDNDPVLTRTGVFKKAGYTPELATSYAHGERMMRINMLSDLAQTCGFELQLVRKC